MRRPLVLLLLALVATPSYALKKTNPTRAERRAQHNAKEAREDAQTEEQEDAEEDQRYSDEEEILYSRPWSFGVGFSGYSSNGSTVFTASGGARYLWNKYTESLVGLELSFGGGTRFGVNAGQRAYVPFFIYFRPFAQAGVSVHDVSQFSATTLDVGGGFQAGFSPYSYFELAVVYQINSIFRTGGSNVVIFQGGSGFRF